MVVGLQALLLSAAGRGERFPFWRTDAAELTASMVIAVGVRMFAVDARYIPTDSMEPTFAVGDHLLLDKVSRMFRPPARGDVVCFQPPAAAVTKHSLPAGSCYLKRVVAVAGDEVQVRNGRLLINGKVQAEPYVSERMGYAMPSRIVPAGHLFVLGDNRNHSYDSHFWGCLPQERVLGMPLCTYWPPLRARGRAAYCGGPRRPLAGSRVVTRALRSLHQSRAGWTVVPTSAAA
jgi:signal peptidase I